MLFTLFRLRLTSYLHFDSSVITSLRFTPGFFQLGVYLEAHDVDKIEKQSAAVIIFTDIYIPLFYLTILLLIYYLSLYDKFNNK